MQPLWECGEERVVGLFPAGGVEVLQFSHRARVALSDGSEPTVPERLTRRLHRLCRVRRLQPAVRRRVAVLLLQPILMQ